MTDKKQTKELNEAELDQVTGAGDTVHQYNLENAWPTKATDSKTNKDFLSSGHSTGVKKLDGSSKINAEGGSNGI
ncbi:MAG: hypothetical protein ABJN65_12275 [Parasphingorhabdus sp.]